MPQSYFCFARCYLRTKFLRPVIVVFTTFSLSAYGAEWRDCEKAKLRELQLQRSAHDQKTSKRKRQRSGESRRQSVEEIDTWLWKNCREYSYELRLLEQEKM